jgi:haloacetate dehalogenase
MRHRIAVIPGDGIGKEVLPEGIRVLDAAGRRVRCPLLALWGAKGVVERCFEPLDEWRRVADHVTGRPLPAGHYLPEEVPDLVVEELERFFE